MIREMRCRRWTIGELEMDWRIQPSNSDNLTEKEFTTRRFIRVSVFQSLKEFPDTVRKEIHTDVRVFFNLAGFIKVDCSYFKLIPNLRSLAVTLKS